jgi:hypothetical protein
MKAFEFRRVGTAVAIVAASAAVLPAVAQGATPPPKSVMVGDCQISGWTDLAPNGNVYWTDVSCATPHKLGVTSKQQFLNKAGEWVDGSFQSPPGWHGATEVTVAAFVPYSKMRGSDRREAGDIYIDGHRTKFHDWQDLRRTHAAGADKEKVTLPAAAADQTKVIGGVNRLSYSVTSAMSTSHHHRYRKGALRLTFNL